ncbi:MAG: hypothetical protein ACRDP7_15855, partial [Trebonia sp.]
LVSGFGWYWWLRSMKNEATDLAVLALRDAPTAKQAIKARGNETRDSETRASEARGDRDLTWLERLATAYGMAGMLTMDSPRPVETVAWLREAGELARWLVRRPGSAGAGPAPLAPDDPIGVHAVAALAGPLRVMVESPMRLEPDLMDEAVADPYPWISALGRVLRGQLSLNQGRLIDQAEADFRAAVATFESLGERWGLAMALTGLAQLEEWRDERAAATHYEQAADLAGELGTTEDEAQARLWLARLLWHLGGADRDRCRVELARALRDADRLGWPEVTAYANYVAGNLARLDGDLATARERLDLAACVAKAQGSKFFGQISAVTFTAMSYLDAAEGDLDAARSWHDEALDAALSTGDSPVVAQVLTGMADVALRGGDALRAATLLGAADGVRGTRNRSDDDGIRVAAAARALLSPAHYSAAFQRGQEVTLATLEAALDGFLTPGA